MDNLGNTIKEIRISKGFSQEELANASLLNLRTIQRIEKNATRPYPKTLALISEALDVDLEQIILKENKEDRRYFQILHLSPLAMIFMPLGNIIAPLVLWFVRKNSIIGLKKAGANLLNFQVLWTLISYIPIVLMIRMDIKANFNQFLILVYISLALYFINIVISIFYAVKAGKGHIALRYPTPFAIFR